MLFIDNGEKAVEKLAARNLAVQYQSLDVASGESIATLADFLKRSSRRHDVLINNAGTMSKEEASAREVNLATVRETLETNTLAPLRLSQEIAPILRCSRRARIVNDSSGMGALSDMQGGYAAYRIFKAALNSVTRILAADRKISARRRRHSMVTAIDHDTRSQSRNPSAWIHSVRGQRAWV
jgi:NAD(P)-dependent dehydrogenase (short-subunit alcohol dehydrogenase family)